MEHKKLTLLLFVLIVCATLTMVMCPEPESKKSSTNASGTPIFTVAFNLNGGVSPAIAEQKVLAGGTANSPKSIPTKEEHTFGGWYRDKRGKDPFFFTTKITKDITLYARWNDFGHYTVRFNTNGGKPVPDDKIILSGNTVARPEKNPTRKRYTFFGWYEDEALTNLFEFDTEITKNTTLYAGWGHTVRFNLNGGTSPAIAEQKVLTGGTAKSPENPTKEKHTFGGWYRDKRGKDPFFFTTKITKDITLYARWNDLGHYTVRFNTNGGKPVPDDQIIPLDDTVTRPEKNPTRKGYTFFGWYEDEALTKRFNFDTEITKNTTLYAGWGHTVQFNLNGGTSPAIAEQQVLTGGTANSPEKNPTREGYTFGGWYSDSKGNDPFFFTTKITKDIMLYAGWNDLGRYTVRFNTNGGTVIDKQTIASGDTVVRPEKNPTRVGHTFFGWYSDKALKNLFDFNTKITKDTTLYAGWGHTVRFNLNGGTPPAIAEQKVLTGGKAKSPENPTREGYIFVGWYSNEALTNLFKFDTKITKDTTLYAGWGHTVQFNLNGGTPPAIAEQQVLTERKAKSPENPTREGYIFVGWYSDKALTNLFEFDTKITKDTTLYAGWGHTVRFNLNGGTSPAIAEQKVLTERKATRPKNDPTKPGYTFVGWYSNEALTNPFDFNTKITKDTTLYAGWGHTVQFNLNGGTPPAIAEQKVLTGGKAKSPENPTREGYIFVGWYSNEALTNLFKFDTKITKDTTLYAGWGHTVRFNLNGGTSPAIAEQKVLTERKATRPKNDPTREGYIFVGWYSNEALTNLFEFDTKITKDTTLYAGWGHTVRFNLNGGTSPAIAEQKVLTGRTAIRPENDPTKPGYTFVGWYSNEALTNLFKFNTKITKDTTLYAGWGHIVRFNLNGGTSTAIAEQKVLTERKAKSPENPTREGYTFFGWYSDKALTNLFDFDTEITKDTTLYAGWGHTVRFNLNGGTSPAIAEQKVLTERKAKSPENPTREGYTFFGWYSDKALTNLFDFDTEITKDTTLYAGWGHTVQFNLNGGTSPAIAEQKVLTERKAKSPENPTREGYTFVGWYSDNAFKNLFDFDTDTITKNTTLYAGWGHTVTFKTIGGTNVPSQKVLTGGKAIRPNDPTKPECIFGDWLIGTKVFNFDTDTITQDITLHARWMVIITFVFDPDLSDKSDMNTQTQQVIPRGSKAPRTKDPTKLGYTFLGWYRDKALTEQIDFNKVVFIRHTTLYPGWGHTVRFNLNGGTSSPAIAEQKVLTGRTAIRPENDPTKPGYTFVGWYSDEALTKRFKFNTKITGDITLYAGWGHTVRFETSKKGEGTAIAKQKVLTGGKATRPKNDPTRVGYIFVGWYSDNAFKNLFDFDTDTITKNTTLYAGWGHTVTFKTIGGTNVPSQKVLTGDKATRPKNDPTRKGYTFFGWYRDKALTNLFDFDTDTITKNTTLYAGWEVTVTFDTNGGTNVPAQKVLVGGKATRPENPTREGYTFVGWYKNKHLTKRFKFTTKISKNITLYAGWGHTVTFDTKGGTNVPPQKVLAGRTVSLPKNPTRKDHTFGGWYRDTQGQVPFFFTTKITKDIILYAGWNAINAYTVRTVRTVRFNLNGGTSPAIAEQKVLTGGKAIRPNDPTREGYTFVDWYRDKALTKRFNFDTKINENITLYAGWGHTVMFDTKGGTDVPPQKVLAGRTVSLPKNPTKEKYTFGGWYRDTQGQVPFFFTTKITKDIILYAGWNAINAYTVRFNLNGGTSSVIAEQKVLAGGKATRPKNDPTRKGYTFVDWYRDKALTKRFNFDTKINENITLYAGWGHTVTFDTKGGTNVPSQKVLAGGKATRPKNDPTRKGDTFFGWYRDKALKNLFDFDTDTITKNTTLYAGWGHTVTFDTKNPNKKPPQKVFTGGKAIRPKPPVIEPSFESRNRKKGRIFVDWYRDEALTKRFKFNTKITKDITLHAGWGYIVTFYTKGGTDVPPQKVLVGRTAINLKNNATKKQAIFVAWYKDSRLTNLFDFNNTKITKDIILYAGWKYQWKAVSAGARHTVGIKADGTLWAWGANEFGKLGNGESGKDKKKHSPLQVGSDTWKAVSAGWHHTVGIKADGTLWAWGYNVRGQLGDGTETDRSSPVQVGSDTWKAVSAGSYHTVGIKADGTLWVWGNNEEGQLGDGTSGYYRQKRRPVQVGSAKWKAVSAGNRHTVGIKADGTLWAWGHNGYGQLGDDTQKDKSSPVQVGSGTWKVASAGGGPSFQGKDATGYVVAIDTTGIPMAWGSNEYGELGINKFSKSESSPKQLFGGGIWKLVSTGDDHTVGIKVDGTLWAWGRNHQGQLGNGDGEYKTKSVPVRVKGRGKWKAVSAGAFHTVGIKGDGALWTWGKNNKGQLGNGKFGENENELIPVSVIER